MGMNLLGVRGALSVSCSGLAGVPERSCTVFGTFPRRVISAYGPPQLPSLKAMGGWGSRAGRSQAACPTPAQPTVPVLLRPPSSPARPRRRMRCQKDAGRPRSVRYRHMVSGPVNELEFKVPKMNYSQCLSVLVEVTELPVFRFCHPKAL